MPPKPKDSNPAVRDPGLSSELMESELVMAVLRSRLGRYQAAGEKLAVENFTLADELAKQKLTLQDINEFLTTELKARSLTAAQLEERVAQLNTRLAEVQKEAQAEITRVRAEAAAAVVAAAAGRAAAAAGPDGAAGEGGSSDLSGQKAQLEQTVAELTAALTARQRDFDAQLSDMERRHLQEKEKMRKEAAAKIRETKMAMAQLADQHLESSTKRTLVENEAMVAELAYHTAQSHDLVAANGILRAEAAELRRQLAIADKTAKSTAQKNLLLLQTIKSILTCLRQEARHNAEEAVAAQQRQHSSTGWQGPAELPAAGGRHMHGPIEDGLSHLHPVTGQQQQQQHWQDMQQQGSPAEHHHAAVLSAAGAAGGFSEQHLQQQQQECSDALTVQQHLEGRVVQLANELSAARKALAAALQAWMPAADTQPQCSIKPKHSPAAATAAAVEQAHCQAHEGSSSNSSNSQGCSSTRPAASKQQKPRARTQQQQQQQQQDPSVSPGTSGPGPMEAALEDGVASFVLFCVQQLRSGSRQQPSSAAAGAGALHSSTKTERAMSKQGPAAAAAGVTRSTSKPTSTTAAAAGGKEGAASPCSSRACNPQAASLVGAHGDLCKDDTCGLSSSEQLARLLLDLLHSYSRHNLLPYDGLSLTFDSSSSAEQQQRSAGTEEGAAGAAAAADDDNAACSEEQAIQKWPAVPLPVASSCVDAGSGGGGAPAVACLGGAGVAAVGVAGGVHASEECCPSLQLPPLPCLLNNMGHSRAALQQQPIAPPTAAAAAGRTGGVDRASAGSSNSGSSSSGGSIMSSSSAGSSKGPPKAAMLELFDAVLADAQPWGAGAAAAAAAAAAGLSKTGKPSAPGALSPSSRGGAGGVLSRSRTPTSPAGVKGGRITPLSSPSSHGKAAVHFG